MTKFEQHLLNLESDDQSQKSGYSDSSLASSIPLSSKSDKLQQLPSNNSTKPTNNAPPSDVANLAQNTKASVSVNSEAFKADTMDSDATKSATSELSDCLDQASQKETTNSESAGTDQSSNAVSSSSAALATASANNTADSSDSTNPAINNIQIKKSRFAHSALGARSVRNRSGEGAFTFDRAAPSSQELYPRRRRSALNRSLDSNEPVSFSLRARNRYRNNQANQTESEQPTQASGLDSGKSNISSNESIAGNNDFFSHLSALKDSPELMDLGGYQEKNDELQLAHSLSTAALSSIASNGETLTSDAIKTTPTSGDKDLASFESSKDITGDPLAQQEKYQQNTSTLSELGFSSKDLEEIESLRRRFSEQNQNGNSTDISELESISDLSARFGLGRLGQDPNNQDNVDPENKNYTYEDLLLSKQSSQEQDTSSYILGTDYGSNSGYSSKTDQASTLSQGKAFTDNSFNLSPAAIPPENPLIAAASILQAENMSIEAVDEMRMNNLSQNQDELKRNELQFKACFLMQAHLPGAVLYDHSERLVYVDPSAATLLGLDLEKQHTVKAIEVDENFYPSRLKFRRQSSGDKASSYCSCSAAIKEPRNGESESKQEWVATPLNLKNNSLANFAPSKDENGNKLDLACSDNVFNKPNNNINSSNGDNLQFTPYTNQDSTMSFASYLPNSDEDGQSSNTELDNNIKQHRATSDQKALQDVKSLENTMHERLEVSCGSTLDQKAEATGETGNAQTDINLAANESKEGEKADEKASNNTDSSDIKYDPDLANIGKSSKYNQGVPYLKLLRLLGRKFTHQFFTYIRYLGRTPACLNPLRCSKSKCPIGREMQERVVRKCPYLTSLEQSDFKDGVSFNHATDSVIFEIDLDQGKSRSFLYIRANAFYDPQGNLLSLTFSLSQQASRYFALLPNVLTDNAICDWDVPSEHYCFSPNYYRMVGYPVYSPDVPTHVPEWINSMVHPEDLNKIYEFHHRIRTMRNHDCFEIYYRLKKADGNYFWCKVTGVVISRDHEGNAMHIIGAFSNINHVVDSYEKIRNKIYTDVLTGLKNRAYMQSRLPYLLHPAQQPLGIIFVDATALKLYNDYLSHTAGDRLLITLTSLLNHSITETKDLVRLSGDEFVCLIPNCTKEKMQEIESGIIESRRQYNVKAPVRMPVFFSFGSSVLDLKESLYAVNPHLLDLNPDEELPSEIFSEAKELFYVAVQASDLQMQYYKRHNKQIHYSLIKTYIENILKYSISLNDSRMSMNFS